MGGFDSTLVPLSPTWAQIKCFDSVKTGSHGRDSEESQ